MQDQWENISLQRHFHDALKASEAYSKSLLESAPDPIVVTDLAGTIILVNSQAQKSFGYNKDELIGKSIELLFSTEIPDVIEFFR